MCCSQCDVSNVSNIWTQALNTHVVLAFCTLSCCAIVSRWTRKKVAFHFCCVCIFISLGVMRDLEHSYLEHNEQCRATFNVPCCWYVLYCCLVYGSDWVNYQNDHPSHCTMSESNLLYFHLHFLYVWFSSSAPQGIKNRNLNWTNHSIM